MGLFDLFRRKAAPAKSPRELFRDDIARRLRELPDVTAVDPLSDEFGLAVKIGGKDSTAFLENVFAETREADPQERERIIGLYLASITEQRDEPLTWAEAEPRVRVVLRAALSARIELDGANPMSCREVLPALREHLVIDHAASMAYATQDQLQGWGVSVEEAFAAAQANMRPMRERGVEVYDEAPSRIWHVTAGDDYEAARLTLPGFLASFRGKVDGAPIAIVPERGSLFVAGDADPATVVRLCEMAEREYLAAARSISAAIYGLNATGEVIPYQAPAGSAVARRVQQAHRTFLMNEYAIQKRELEAMYSERGIDVFVASFTVASHPEKPAFSYSSWSLGVDSLLPEAENVILGSDDAEPVMIPWEAAVRVAGDHLRREPKLFPPRWRTATQVPAAVVAQLRAAGQAL